MVAGKRYPLEELIHVHRKLTESFLLLQVNGIANRDIKPHNIILVENPIVEGKFYLKISDFGISCKLDKGIDSIPATSLSGLTREYAAPEVLLLFEKLKKGEHSRKETNMYNPFLSRCFFIWSTHGKDDQRKMDAKGYKSKFSKKFERI